MKKIKSVEDSIAEKKAMLTAWMRGL